jgi:hypothetical protein
LGLGVWFFQFHDHFTDGRIPWASDQLVARPLPNLRTTQTQNKHIHIRNIHALCGIRTHDHDFRASEDSSCLRPLGYRDRPVVTSRKGNYILVSIKQYYRKTVNNDKEYVIPTLVITGRRLQLSVKNVCAPSLTQQRVHTPPCCMGHCWSTSGVSRVEAVSRNSSAFL